MYVRSCCIKNSDSPHLVSVPCLHTCVHVRMYMPAQVCQAQEVVPTFSKQSFVWNASNVNSWLSLHSHMLKIGQEWYVDTGSLLKPCKPSANLHACVGLLVVWRRPGPLRIHNHLPRGAARFSDHGHSRRIRTYMHRCNFGFTCSFASTCCNLSWMQSCSQICRMESTQLSCLSGYVTDQSKILQTTSTQLHRRPTDLKEGCAE